MRDLNIKPVYWILFITLYSCKDYHNEDSEYIRKIGDSIKIYNKYDSLLQDMGETMNYSNNKFIQIRDSINNIIDKNANEIRDSIILNTIEIYNAPCPVVNWVPMDGKKYIRIPKFIGGIDSIKTFFQHNFRQTIFRCVKDTNGFRKFVCSFSVIKKAQNISISTDEKDTLLIYPYYQELNRIIHTLPCWSVNNFILAESKDSLLNQLSVKKQHVTFEVILDKKQNQIDIVNFHISDN